MKRHNLKSILPTVVRRVHAAEFASQAQMAREYGIDKATATKWKRRAIALGLSDDRAWQRGFILGQVSVMLGGLAGDHPAHQSQAA